MAWDVPPDQEEPWRRFLQELSASSNHEQEEEEYARSRRALGITAESVWLAPKASGGGVAILYLEVLDPERVLGELAASEAPFDSWYGTTQARSFSGMDLGRFARVAPGELLLSWRDDDVAGEVEAPEAGSERESR